MKIKDVLQDLVDHIQPLDGLSLVKITSNNNETTFEARSDKIVLFGKLHEPVSEFQGTFGLPNLEKLSYHLKNPEYADNAKIEIINKTSDNETYPSVLHFENKDGDFQNDYRFVSPGVVNNKFKEMQFICPPWDITFVPTITAIGRLKLQANAHTDEIIFKVKVDKTNLVISFGDVSSHLGSFIFHQGITGKLKHSWTWSVEHVLSVLNLQGDKVIKISDHGLLQVVIDSGIAEYTYNLPVVAM